MFSWIHGRITEKDCFHVMCGWTPCAKPSSVVAFQCNIVCSDGKQRATTLPFLLALYIFHTHTHLRIDLVLTLAANGQHNAEFGGLNETNSILGSKFTIRTGTLRISHVGLWKREREALKAEPMGGICIKKSILASFLSLVNACMRVCVSIPPFISSCPSFFSSFSFYFCVCVCVRVCPFCFFLLQELFL